MNALVQTILSKALVVGLLVGCCTFQSCRHERNTDKLFVTPGAVDVEPPEDFAGADNWPEFAGSWSLNGPWQVEATISQTSVEGPPLRVRVVVSGTVNGRSFSVKERQVEPASLDMSASQWPQELLAKLSSATAILTWLKQAPAAPEHCTAEPTPNLEATVRRDGKKLSFKASVAGVETVGGWVKLDDDGNSQSGRIVLLRSTRFSGPQCTLQQVERYTLERVSEPK